MIPHDLRDFWIYALCDMARGNRRDTRWRMTSRTAVMLAEMFAYPTLGESEMLEPTIVHGCVVDCAMILGIPVDIDETASAVVLA